MNTVLFVDIVGSTGLYERLGNETAKRLVTDCLNRLRIEVQAHAGEVVQAIGDELMCRFPDAKQACAAAIAMQKRIAEPLPDSPCEVQVRIGLQSGEVLSEGNNLYGDAVNTAARLSHVAQGGQIMTSDTVVRQVAELLHDRWRQIGALRLKGKEAPLAVFEIFWSEQDQTGLQAATRITKLPSRLMPLYVAFGEERIALGPDNPRIILGRDKDNDLVIPYPEASRRHATIEQRLDKHYLIDHSANGTTVIGSDRIPWVLHREEAPLTGSGHILCGFSQKAADERIPVDFFVDYTGVPSIDDADL